MQKKRDFDSVFDKKLRKIGKYNVFQRFSDESKNKIKTNFYKNGGNEQNLNSMIRKECKKYANYYQKTIEKCNMYNLCYKLKNLKI